MNQFRMIRLISVYIYITAESEYKKQSPDRINLVIKYSYGFASFVSVAYRLPYFTLLGYRD